MGIVKQRVRVSITVEVDVQGWEQDYGVSGTQEIREDVRNYLDSVVRECNDNLSITEVRV
jgi:hypothetical protein